MKTPKELNFRMPPEWYPHERCWMAWPCHQETWTHIGLGRAELAYVKIAQAIAEFEPVIMLANPQDCARAQSLCGSHIQIVPMALNDSWMRDIGPTFLLNDNQQLAGIDWIHNAWGGNYADCLLDNNVATQVMQLLTQCYDFHAPLVMEGGSFHTNGEGTILTSKECLLNPNRNPLLSQNEIESYLCDYLDANHIIWLNKGLLGDETDGHIDEIASFISPDKILCLITNDIHDPNYDRLQENYHILKSAKDSNGNSFEIHTIEQPPAVYVKDERLTLSYVNFYLANGGVVLPAFNSAEHDLKALKLFQKLYPERQIKQVESIELFTGGGGIHCITQQQPISKRIPPKN